MTITKFVLYRQSYKVTTRVYSTIHDKPNPIELFKAFLLDPPPRVVLLRSSSFHTPLCFAFFIFLSFAQMKKKKKC